MRAADPFDYVQDWNQRLSAKGWWHSFELPDGTRIDGVCDLPGLKNRIAQFPIPSDLRGRRVLDIGAWDGWFSFEMERRGAEVVAIDCWDNPRFREMHARLNSRIDYRVMDVYDLSPDGIGRFDIVLFMGVLYHLKHPLLALERVCSVTTGMAAVDTFVLKEEHRQGCGLDRRPIMEFYETDEFGGQTDNWVGPSLPCLLAFCRTAGFARVEFLSMLPHSACVACYRHWEPVPSRPSTAPVLLDIFHHTNFGINFDSHRDEYVTCWFDSHCKEVTLDLVKPEVDGYGVRPIHVSRVADRRWQATFKLPPGLALGWRAVRVRVGDTAPSNCLNLAVDVPLGSPTLAITGVADGHSWKPNEIDLTNSNTASIWITGLPENADRNNIRIYLQGGRCSVTYVEPCSTRTAGRQVNAVVPHFTPAGRMQIWAEVGDGKSQLENLDVLK